MTLRLSDLVVWGELNNTRKHAVFGRLGLRGCETPVVFELTGECAADLAGKRVRFEVRNAEEIYELEERGEETKSPRLDGMAWMQIGPTGMITASRRVRVADIPPVEMYELAKMGVDTPTEWKRCLYMEWYGQNGRVVVEVVDPVMELVEGGGRSGDEERVSPFEPPLDEEPPDPMAGGLDIRLIQMGEDGEAEVRDVTPDPDEREGCDGECAESEDVYGLFSGELQRQLDAEAQAMDRALDDCEADSDPGAEKTSKLIREMELMDDLIDHGEGEPLGVLFDGPLRLRQPDSLSEEEAEKELKALLARLALYGVALHMCEHYTMADAYRLLVKKVCVQEKAYPELRGTQWVQHYTTSDYCPACDAEFESTICDEAG